jgi:hypothetical protein
MALDKEEFKFPDEVQVDTKADDKKVDFEIEGDAEIEVVDDTPEADKGRAPMKEPPADVTDDELAKYSEGVKQRIQHFSKGYHEERRAKEAALREREEALRLTQRLLEENQKLQKSAGQSQQVAIEQAKKAVEGELDAARKKYEKAYEEGDAKAVLAAQEELFSVKLKAEKLAAFRPPKPTPVQTPENVVQTPPTPQVDPKTRAWQEANPWFGSNLRMSAVAMEIHRELEREGVPAGSDEYFNRIDSEMKSTFPGAFTQEKKKSSVVAPATRSTAPKKIVLTQTQVTLAKRLGLTPEQYARAVAEQMRKDNG